jgi:hypothetical protein
MNAVDSSVWVEHFQRTEGDAPQATGFIGQGGVPVPAMNPACSTAVGSAL